MGKRISGLLLMAALVLPAAVWAQTDKSPQPTAEDKQRADKAAKLNKEGSQFYVNGKFKEAAEKFEEALALRRKLYPPERFPDGHPYLAQSLNNMGYVLVSLGEPSKALPFCEQALAMYRQLYPHGHPDLAISLDGVGHVLVALGKPAEALPYRDQALAMRRQLYPPERFPDGHTELARSLMNMGDLLKALGQPSKALPFCEQALAMRRQLYPPGRFLDGHADLAHSLNNMAELLGALGQPSKALPFCEEALAMCHRLYPPKRFPDGHPYLVLSLNNMGYVLDALGQPSEARPYFEQALIMRRQLYPPKRFPDGHPYLALSLNNMGYVLNELGQPTKALPFCEQALAMYRQLYSPARFKDGHPDLAFSLNNMGPVRLALGQPSKALRYHEEALAMCRKLYPPERFPDGHAELARSLMNMGYLQEALGQPSEALPCFEQALAMYRKLYPPKRFPDGHRVLSISLNNMGFGFLAQGLPAKALPYFEQALTMRCQLGRRETGKSSEFQVLAYRQALKQIYSQNAYLSVAAAVPPSTTLYAPVWHSRGGLLPLLQARHQAVLARLAASPDARKHYDNLITARQKISGLQADSPKDETARKARDKELAKLNDEQDRLERQLANDLPQFQHLREMDQKTPADLARALPPDAAFVDFIRYTHWEKTKATGRRYVAFVVTPDKEPIFLQLGDAKPIDTAIAAWRKHIENGQDSLAPAKLRELVWDKVAQKLPAKTNTVYLCPDGDLARMPFATLPGSAKDTVLLEEYALAVVPSGPWLLDQLLHPPPDDKASQRLLAVGAVDYGRSGGTDPYAALEGTSLELKRVLEAFGQTATDGLSGRAATTAAVRQRLTQARYAHFATHGYFDEASLAAERQRLQEYLNKWTFQADDTLAGVGLRNPAGYVGLALAGANDAKNAGPDGGILTGLSVVDLPLEELRLCVLSACETGLGALTEGEGVVGLQRAFHAAGCPNVVGSLWKVSDAATAALMTQFYHELRIKGRPALVALREAQLTVYRHPERVADLAGERGRPALEAAAKKGSAADPAKSSERPRRAATKQWAAFVLSGAGTAK